MVTDRPIGDLIPFLLTLRDSGVRFLAVDMPEANDLTVGMMALVARAEREAVSRWTKEALVVAKSRAFKLGNPNGAAALRRAGKGGVALRAAVAANAELDAQDLAAVVAQRILSFNELMLGRATKPPSGSSRRVETVPRE